MKIKLIGSFVTVATLIYVAYLYTPYKVVSKSMLPTLVENEIVVFKKYDNIHSLEHGDIVMFNVLSNPNVVKRIIGLPGDKITYSNKSLSVIKHCDIKGLPNKVTPLNCATDIVINGDETDISDNAVDRIMYSIFLGSIGKTHYKYTISSFVPSREKHFFVQEGNPIGQWVVPEGMIFVLGDNRDLSLDSRIYGFIPFEKINGIML